MKRTWWIEENQDGTVTLAKGQRDVLEGVSRTEALRYLKRYIKSGDKVMNVATDGYRTDITRRYAPSRDDAAVPQSPSAPRRRAPVRMPLMRF